MNLVTTWTFLLKISMNYCHSLCRTGDCMRFLNIQTHLHNNKVSQFSKLWPASLLTLPMMISMMMNLHAMTWTKLVLLRQSCRQLNLSGQVDRSPNSGIYSL